MAVLDQKYIRPQRRSLRSFRSVTCTSRCKHTGLAVHGTPNPVPAAAAWEVCKALHATQVSHHVGAARCGRQVAARYGQADPCRAVAACYKSRRVAAVVERASRGHQPRGPKAADDGVFTPLFARAGESPRRDAGNYWVGADQRTQRAELGGKI